MFTNKTSLIIPTRNRYKQISRNLEYFKNNLILFNEILIIDSSSYSHKEKLKLVVKKYKNIKLFFCEPSSSKQRNLGLKKANKKSKYIMFLDDDIYFYKNSFLKMDKTIKNEPRNTIGFSFNIINKKSLHFLDKIKKNFIFKLLKIYSDQPGKVTESGWHTKILNLKKDVYTDWLSTQAVVFFRKDLNNAIFEERLGQYSYLEDLDFSYRLKKNKKKMLKVVADAKYKSPLIIARHGFQFGKIEILNRFLFIKKNSFNYGYFIIGCFFRSFQSLIAGVIFFNLKSIKRFFGNLYGIVITMKKN